MAFHRQEKNAFSFSLFHETFLLLDMNHIADLIILFDKLRKSYYDAKKLWKRNRVVGHGKKKKKKKGCLWVNKVLVQGNGEK